MTDVLFPYQEDPCVLRFLALRVSLRSLTCEQHSNFSGWQDSDAGPRCARNFLAVYQWCAERRLGRLRYEVSG